MGKNFKKAAEDAVPVYSSIIWAAQDTQDADQEQKALDELKTQGKRGEKLDRINMAFTPENYDYIRTMSKLKGQTMTQFVNVLVAVERARNGTAYDAAKAILASL